MAWPGVEFHGVEARGVGYAALRPPRVPPQAAVPESRPLRRAAARRARQREDRQDPAPARRAPRGQRSEGAVRAPQRDGGPPRARHAAPRAEARVRQPESVVSSPVLSLQGGSCDGLIVLDQGAVAVHRRRPVDAVPVRLAAHARARAAACHDGNSLGSDALHPGHAVEKRRRLESHPAGSGNQKPK